ncbi:retrovirus-related pol polyprotein from transposon TNT 1-94, partial [Tanacetum coccineum]
YLATVIVLDILCIQVSTVASESAFSASGRVLDPYRNSLAPNIVEALVCTQDWIRTSSRNITMDTLEDLMKDNELAKGVIPTTSVSRPHLKSNRIGDRVLPNNSQGKKQELEDHPKYAQEILKKHGMTSCDSIGTPMATKHLDSDLSGTSVDQTKYHSMVGALMYLTASRPDIVHATCYCARYQAKPTEKHLTAVKRIFWCLKDTINMGLWYPKDIGFELTAFSDSNHTGCLDSRKSTSGDIQFLGGDKLVSWSSKKQDCTSMSSAEANSVRRFKYLVRRLGMRSLTPEELEVLANESA